MKLLFEGDRRSKTIKVGRFLKKYLPRIVKVAPWDGYRSRIVIERTK